MEPDPSVSNEEGEAESEAATLTVEGVDDLQTAQVAFWRFDEESGLVASDSSGNGRDGELMGYDGEESQWVGGQVGGALQFDKEQSNRVVILESVGVEFGDNLTVSFWLKPETFGPAQDAGSFLWSEGFIVRKGSQLSVSIADDPSQSASKSVMFGGTGGFLGTPKTRADLGVGPGNFVEAGTWQHFAMVVKDGTRRFFKDGQALGPAEPYPDGLGSPNTADLAIGNFQAALEPVRLYHGLMDDMGIWDRALNEQEVEGIYQNGALGKPLTEEFEPLTIRSLELFPAEGDLVLTLFSPFPDREFAVQRKVDFEADEWIEESEASFSEAGQGEYEASLPMPDGDPRFYRVVALAPAAILEADFEDGGGDWTHGGENDSWEVGTPTSGPGEAVSGENVYATSLAGNFQANSDAYLRSPTINLTDVNRATLSFQEFRNVDSEITFHYTAVSVLNAEDNSVIRELSRDSGQTEGWQPRSFSLGTDVVGNEVKIELRLVTDGFNQLPGWYIDDVVIRPN